MVGRAFFPRNFFTHQLGSTLSWDSSSLFTLLQDLYSLQSCTKGHDSCVTHGSFLSALSVQGKVLADVFLPCLSLMHSKGKTFSPQISASLDQPWKG